MGIIRPTKSASNDGFVGYKRVSILNITDMSAKYDWADIYLDVELALEGSKYSNKLQIKGSFEYQGDTIQTNSLVKNIYHFLDAINCNIGINGDGKWEDQQGNPVDDVATFLNQHYASGKTPDAKDHTYNLWVYLYNSKPTKAGKKSYKTVHNYVQPATAEGKAELQRGIEWRKANGYLNELTPEEAKVHNESNGKTATAGMSNSTASYNFPDDDSDVSNF
tara:strand:+ start:159 stop:821 length:663 start_codon:yes stop_codon:yes gene_type:complete